jgi:hypothetical protein
MGLLILPGGFQEIIKNFNTVYIINIDYEVDKKNRLH